LCAGGALTSEDFAIVQKLREFYVSANPPNVEKAEGLYRKHGRNIWFQLEAKYPGRAQPFIDVSWNHTHHYTAPSTHTHIHTLTFITCTHTRCDTMRHATRWHRIGGLLRESSRRRRVCSNCARWASPSIQPLRRRRHPEHRLARVRARRTCSCVPRVALFSGRSHSSRTCRAVTCTIVHGVISESFFVFTVQASSGVEQCATRSLDPRRHPSRSSSSFSALFSRCHMKRHLCTHLRGVQQSTHPGNTASGRLHFHTAPAHPKDGPRGGGVVVPSLRRCGPHSRAVSVFLCAVVYVCVSVSARCHHPLPPSLPASLPRPAMTPTRRWCDVSTRCASVSPRGAPLIVRVTLCVYLLLIPCRMVSLPGAVASVVAATREWCT
jgi:hypothetical protein